ncbi:RbsD/FucU family protein [bacterium]|nr:RbsD/FucU family protein [Akkermansiaceae bacterium]MDB4412632.1 RbsD/FucU family protein [bacterium]MDB4283353.1 RbsD/FucU family protein [Akkermansiaceae bacterium]MDB4387648.1 RbsD/FucU family protein [Akkermansiaceae bacterium]MDB4429682.1 RbsD/FucU family protein [Akkermansiaceae bacterium]
MIQEGILNPQINHLLSRVRHTNTIVIADWAFPYWKDIEVVDIALTRGIPKITDLLDLLAPNFKVGHIWQAEQFLDTNPQDVIDTYNTKFDAFKSKQPNLQVTRLDHDEFKKMVPNAIGLIRTGDPTAYGNLILESV